MNKLIAKNERGIDYIVGDIHGCFTQLDAALDALDFDETKDRLFTCGDLVDRGPESEKVDAWLTAPWFYSTLGNHEQMAIDIFDGFGDLGNYSYNGGDWFLKLDKEDRKYYYDLFKQLPLIMEVQVGDGKIGIVHAECLCQDWEEFKRIPIEQNDNALWGRDKISMGDAALVKNIDTIYVGHTPVRQPVMLGNHHYMDTGVVFGNGEFIIKRIN